MIPRVDAPAHAIFVHFSIALTAASVIFDVGSRVLDIPSLADAGWWTLAASTAVTILTIVTGLISRLLLPMEVGLARRFLRAHMALGPLLFGLLLALCVERASLWYRGLIPPMSYLVAAAAVLALMTIQGFLGGELVYRWGAHVRGSYERLPTEAEREVPGR